MSIRLDFPVPEIEELIKGGTVRVFEGEGAGRTFGSYGHGAQRAIQMAMVRHLSDLRRGEGIVGGAPLLLVDEPELFMHPFAIEQVREALRALSQAGYQVVFSTHSAQMILPADAQNAILMTKTQAHGTTAREKLKEVVRAVEGNARHQLYHLFSLTNSAQILFADKVVLTEGKTELRLLPHIFEKVSGASLGQSAIALVALGGVANTEKTIRILEALGIPSCAIVDLDFVFRHAQAHGILDQVDADIDACLAVLGRLAAEGVIDVDVNRLPQKGPRGVSAAKAFELMARDQEAMHHVERLVLKLRGRKIWLWRNGAIESHLGFEAKNESAWLEFQLRCAQEDFDQVCADHALVRELIAWIRAA